MEDMTSRQVINSFASIDRTMVRGKIFCDDGVFRQGTVILEGGVVVGVDFALANLGKVGPDKYIIPGLVDIHLHGAAGVDGSKADVDGLKKIDEYERNSGIAAYCMATMTLPYNDIESMCDKIYGLLKSGEVKGLQGLYFEGPYINKDKCGAQNAKNACVPTDESVKKLEKLLEDFPCIKYVVLAPELSGAVELIKKLTARGVKVSIGHTMANYEEAIAGFEAGATQVTHLYNAMPIFYHREPGVIGAAFDEAAFVELITDGYHISPSAVRSTFAMYGEDRVVLVSDSMMATGLEDGKYTLGDQEVFVSNREATIRDNGRTILAGSASNLYECMVSAIKMGVPVEKAIKAATINPARSLGIDGRYGSIAKGKAPGFIVADETWKIEKVIF